LPARKGSGFFNAQREFTDIPAHLNKAIPLKLENYASGKIPWPIINFIDNTLFNYLSMDRV